MKRHRYYTTMRKFIEFKLHDYMDMYPTSSFIAMEESEVQDYVDYMRKNYSGGTTSFVRVLTKEEATEHILKEIKSVIDRPTITHSDGSLDSKDVEFINNLIIEFNTCYGRL